MDTNNITERQKKREGEREKEERRERTE